MTKIKTKTTTKKQKYLKIKSREKIHRYWGQYRWKKLEWQDNPISTAETQVVQATHKKEPFKEICQVSRVFFVEKRELWEIGGGRGREQCTLTDEENIRRRSTNNSQDKVQRQTTASCPKQWELIKDMGSVTSIIKTAGVNYWTDWKHGKHIYCPKKDICLPDSSSSHKKRKPTFNTRQ
jgi:hypothetical protein